MAVCIGVVAGISAAIQAVCWLTGVQFNILSATGRSVTLCIGLAVLLVLMMLDRRTAAEYGLALDQAWAKQVFGGAALGAAFYGGYCLLVWALGGFELRHNHLTLRHTLRGLQALLAFPVAATQQFIFSGYLLSTARQRYRPLTAVLITSFLFAALTVVGKSNSGLIDHSGQRLFVGMFCVAALLATVRLRTGTIALSTGILAGCIACRRLFRKTGWFDTASDSALLPYLAPAGDPRQAPAFWGLLALGMLICAVWLWRKGERQIPADVSLPVSFNKMLPFSNFNATAPLDLWLRQLVDARFRIDWIYLPRLLFVLLSSAISTITTLPERVLAPRLLRHRVRAPLFVVGVHRSGTTHLHNLLALDRQFCTPRNYQVYNPMGFLSTGWLWMLLVGPFMTWRRPMDSVAMHAFSPQEEEFAVTGLTTDSPYWGFYFPRRIEKHEQAIFPDRLPEDRAVNWRRCYSLFLQKITLFSKRRPVLKSPYNTGRVGLFREMFSDAQFIHIVRRPHDVYRSNMHLAKQGLVMFQLQEPDDHDNYCTRFLNNYRELEDAYYRDAAQLPPGAAAELCFEDLESDPIGEIRRLYGELQIEYTCDFDTRLRRYLDSLASYQKNRHRPLDAQSRQRVDEVMSPYLKHWNYGETSRPQRPAA